MGADINAKLGGQDSDELSPVLGPHGPSRQITRGTNLLSLFLSNGLRIENTFFATPSHYTFTNINNGKQTMIDVFACSQQLHCQVHNCRIMTDRVQSNHSAVRLDLTMMSLKHKMSTTLTRGTINWHKIASNTATNEHYNNVLLASIEMIAMSCEDFNKSIALRQPF